MPLPEVKVPAVQLSQIDDPSSAAKVPFTQRVHPVASAALKRPPLQRVQLEEADREL